MVQAQLKEEGIYLAPRESIIYRHISHLITYLLSCSSISIPYFMLTYWMFFAN